MNFVLRDRCGRIMAVAREPDMSEVSGWTSIASDDPEFVAFLDSMHPAEGHSRGPADARTGDVEATDAGLIRVLEDLVNLLVERGVIRFTDLPPPAQAKLTERLNKRAELRKLVLLDDESDVI